MTTIRRTTTQRLSTFLAAAACLHSLALPAPTHAQEQDWHFSAHLGWATPDGQFSATRPNGKTIHSDIDPGLYLSVQAERRLNARWGLIVGFEGSPGRRFSIDQDFPDNTQFSSGDSFNYSAVMVGPIFHFRPTQRLSWGLETLASWGWFDDVSVAGAGPPFDRTAPIELDVESRLGVGLAAHAALTLGDGWRGIARTGLTIQRFQGLFPDDPTLPGSGGDVDVPLNPVYVAVGMRWSR